MRLLDQDSGVPVVFSNSNGVSFGSNGVTITASVNAGGTSVAAIAVNALTTYTSGTVVFSNANGVTWGTNAQTITASVATQTGNLGAIADSVATISNNTVVFSNANGISFGLNGSTMTASINGTGNGFMAGISSLGATSGDTGTIASQLVLVGTNGIGLSGSTNGSSATVSFQPSPYFSNYMFVGGSEVNAQLGASSVYIWPTNFGWLLTATRVNLFGSVSISSSSNSSHGGTLTIGFAIYTRSGSTLSSASSSTKTFAWTNTSSNSLPSLSGSRMFSIPLNINITPGEYWFAVVSATASANANWYTISNAVYSMNTTAFDGVLGAATNATNVPVPGWGYYSSAQTTFPNSFQFSQVSLPGRSELYLPQVHLCNFTA